MQGNHIRKYLSFSDGDVDAWVGGKGDKGGDGGGKLIDYAEGKCFISQTREIWRNLVVLLVDQLSQINPLTVPRHS